MSVPTFWSLVWPSKISERLGSYRVNVNFCLFVLQVKRRYDNVARIWEELPIRKDRDKKESREETDGLRPIDRPSIADGDGEVSKVINHPVD